MRSTIAITAGDPAGIGLEVTLKAVRPVLHAARWVLFTDSATFDKNYAAFGHNLPFRWIDTLADLSDEPILFLQGVPGKSGAIPWGALSADAGKRAFGYLRAASDAALAGRIAGLVTAPVSKEAIGGSFAGQTDQLAEWAGVSRYAMSFFAPTFKVVLATVHLSLRDALARLDTARYVDLIRLTSSELRRFQYEAPRIAVSAVNPHAGEGGMFGREDMDVLKPAVDQCRSEGIDVSGPHAADSLYYRAHSGEFDVVIAPYHDQGLIPVKLIAHGESTNVTLGLPYVRTSPDHGTAFTIAGRGDADPGGMKSALQRALELVERQSAQSP